MTGSRGGRAGAGRRSGRARLLVLGSGGQVFREYALRAMATHADLVLISAAEPAWERPYCAGGAQSARKLAASRHPARLATCIKFLYKSGVVAENSAGDAARDPAFRQYYPLAAKGGEVRAAPDGFEICGLLSVWDRYDPADHPARVRRTAARVAGKLSVDVRLPRQDGTWR